jgi:hypothetical protein
MTTKMGWLLALLVAALSGCVITPESETRIEHRADEVFFQGYGQLGSSPIVLKAKNWQTGAWEEIGRTVTNHDAGIAENTWGTHPALYYWSITVPVAHANNAAELKRWRLHSCNDTNPQPVPGSGIGSTTGASCLETYDAELIISQPADNGRELWTLPQGGGKCLVDKITADPPEPLIDSFVSCSTRSAILDLSAGR